MIYSNALHRGFELRSFRQKIDTLPKNANDETGEAANMESAANENSKQQEEAKRLV